MIRNLWALGLILVAVIALNAVTAAAASAQQGKLTSDGPVTLTGTEVGIAGENTLTAFGGKTECPGSTGTGYKYNVTPHTFIPSGATTVTITPDVNQLNCVFTFVGIKHPATVTMNECDFVVHIGVTTGGADSFGGTSDIVCPVGHMIDEDIYPVGTVPSEHATKAQFCTVTVPAQTGLSGVDVTTDTANDDLLIKGTLEKITIRKELAGCGASETKEGKIDMNVVIKGKNETGGSTGITITD